ncbi:MAG TPA: glycoside hydrolase family 9 protein [Allosphingosinicella sp.]|jgi:endoglucanase
MIPPSRALLAASAAFLAAAESPPAQIRLNQVGLLPDGPKRAMLPSAEKRPLPWRLTDRDGKVVASGNTEVFGVDRWSGEHVHRIDFTSVRRAGSGYRLQAGGAQSRPFAISADAFQRLPGAALSYFYQNRAGIPIEARFAGGPQWARPAGHPDERATCVSGKDSKGNAWPGCSYTLDVAGGWYDAGDHGKYVVNAGISVWTLMNLYERGRLRGAPGPFPDGAAAIPEAGNGVSDILDEARWEIEFLLKMQVPEGTRLRLPVGAKESAPGLAFSEIDASGMAHHKVADEKWTPLPTAPHKDPERRQLFPPSTGATLNLAAAAAQCARLWREIDATFSARCLAAAERAWTAARRNPNIYPIADFTGSGAYGDTDFTDEFYWAAAELFLTTRDPRYQDAVKASSFYRVGRVPEPGWNSVAALGTISLALAPDLPGDERSRQRAAILAAADAYLADSAKTGYAVPYAPARGYPWGSSGAILNRAILLALAHDFTGDAQYRDGVVDALDFILGRNPLDRSFVSGFGARPMANPHHRFWARQFDPAFPPPPPGGLSGGPNDTAMAEEVARALKGRCAPQTCWADDARAFSLNEVAINWNAPLVWVSAWAAEPSKSGPAPRLAITIDDLPVHRELPPGETPLGIARQVIAAFKAAKVPAVHGFVNGGWTERQPETEKVLRAWTEAGFPLGNHTWSHSDANSATVAEYEREIARNEPLLKRLGGRDWRWFRYPFLAEGEMPEKRAAVRAILARRGYRVADVTMDFSDWRWTAPYARCKADGNEAAIASMERAYLDSAQENIVFYRSLSQSLYGRDIPYVLLMHIGAFDARMLPRLLDLYRREGFRFVTLAEAERDPFYREAIEPSLPAAPQGLEGRAAARGLQLPPRKSHAAMLDLLCRK